MDCAIRTDDAMVSRHHARMYWGGGGFVIEDLGSANGVYYQEQRVQSHLLKHGDAVRCGSLWLRFIDTAQLEPQLHQASGYGMQAPPGGGMAGGMAGGMPGHGGHAGPPSGPVSGYGMNPVPAPVPAPVPVPVPPVSPPVGGGAVSGGAPVGGASGGAPA